jgi:hypothetical protein
MGDVVVGKQFAIGVAFTVLYAGAGRAQTVDPQDVLNQLIRRQQIEDRQRFEDRQRERLRQQQTPDFSQYGVPAPTQPQVPHRSFGCITFGDGMGDGITDCD